MKRSTWVVLGLVVVLGAAGCASVPAPTDRIEAARRAIAEAEQDGAFKDAPLEFYLAREHLENAKEAVHAKDNARARRLADEAVASAELARAKSLAAASERDAEELRRSLEDARTRRGVGAR